MYNGKTIFGLIPARGESKELPRKNIREILGKPLIAWTIEQALASKYLDRVIVSTDDTEIAEISKKYSAEVPFFRPEILSTDDTNMIDVIIHFINWFEAKNVFFDLIMLLQPTSPLRTTNDIDNSVKLLFKKKAKAIISVTKSKHNPYWSNILPKNDCMKNFIQAEVSNKNRQELPTYFILNGAIYLANREYLKKQKGFFGNKTFALIMPEERSIDIDRELDFELARFILEKITKDGERKNEVL